MRMYGRSKENVVEWELKVTNKSWLCGVGTLTKGSV